MYPLYNINGEIDYCVTRSEASCGWGNGKSLLYPALSVVKSSTGFDTLGGCHQIDPYNFRCPAMFKSFYSASSITCHPANASCSTQQVPVYDGGYNSSTLFGCAHLPNSYRCPVTLKSFINANGTIDHCRLANATCATPYSKAFSDKADDPTPIGCVVISTTANMLLCPMGMYGLRNTTGALIMCYGTSLICPLTTTRQIWRNRQPGGSGGTLLGCYPGRNGTSCADPTTYDSLSGHCYGTF